MKQLITTILPLFVAFSVLAQAPQAFNYQGVARNLAGSPLPNRIIRLRVSILSGSPTGSAVYKETHQATTTDIGLFNLQIGKGALVLGSFSAIDWGSNPHFVQIEMDENGGSNYQLVGTSQLLSVPYALYSNNGSQWNNNASGINYNNGNVGIGSGSPTFARLNIVGKTVGLNDGERLFYGTVPDAPNDFIAITNGASEKWLFQSTYFEQNTALTMEPLCFLWAVSLKVLTMALTQSCSLMPGLIICLMQANSQSSQDPSHLPMGKPAHAADDNAAKRKFGNWGHLSNCNPPYGR
ncbi:MAG: hypothetical protein IPH16_15850 [Haliscomenobacter sp.]|nr:hypothetical protein [Haliscomenobacter sp.]